MRWYTWVCVLELASWGSVNIHVTELSPLWIHTYGGSLGLFIQLLMDAPAHVFVCVCVCVCVRECIHISLCLDLIECVGP